MITSIFYNEMTYWLFATAIVFTFVGRRLTVKDSVETIVSNTIDSLIAQGYIKTDGQGKDMQILKYWESKSKK